MKKLIFVLCTILFVALSYWYIEKYLTYDWKSEEHPTGYKIHEEEMDTDPKYFIIGADCIMDDWYESIPYEQYSELEQVFAKDRWQKISVLHYQVYDAAITIRIYPGDYQYDREFLIYADDKVMVNPGDSDYQMPAGTCEKINAYLQQYYQKQHDTVANLETFFPDFFTGKYETTFRHHYNMPRYKNIYGWVSADDMFCPGSPRMSKELMTVFGDRKQWTECPYDSNLWKDWNENKFEAICFQCKNLNGQDYTIRIMRHGDGRTYIAVNTYAAFLAPPEIYNEVKEILNHYEAQWEVIPLEE